MSDSDSPLSDAPPPSIPLDARIASALRDVVRQAFKNNDFENLTLKRVRAAVTKQLELPDGFLKSDQKWGDKSKSIVTEEVNKNEENHSKATSAPIKPQPKSPSTSKAPVQKPAGKSRSAPAKPAKRKTPDSSAPRNAPKRRKRSVSDSDEEQFNKTNKKNNKSDGDDSTSGLSEAATTPEASQSSASPAPTASPKKTAGSKPQSNDIKDLGSDSDLSEVLDEVPKSKSKPKKRDKSPKRGSSSSKPQPKKAKAKAEKQLTPQDEEIKRLQSQLAKCGIRKLWGKELAKFDSSRDKIDHLKELLRDAGMDGRFSEEKARQIKEARELKADLEAIQEGDEMWGTKEEAPRKRLAKGLLELQGLGDDEESD